MKEGITCITGITFFFIYSGMLMDNISINSVLQTVKYNNIM